MTAVNDTTERTYHPCLYLLDGEDGYLLWYDGDGEKDGVFVDAAGKMLSFRTKAALIEFALPNGLRVSREEPDLHHLDSVEAWLANPHPQTLDRDEAIIAWNLFKDVAESVDGAGAAFKTADTGLLPIYNKLFEGFSQPSDWALDDEPYDPELSPEELQTLVELLTIGFRMFRQARS